MSYGQGDKLHLILDAAYELFGSDGFYETKMSDIADKAGIAKGTLYLYFNSKEQLFTAMSQRDFDHFLGDLEFGLNQFSTLEEQLRFIAGHHLRYYYERKRYTKLFFKAPNNDPDMMEVIRSFMQRYMKLMANAFAQFGMTEPMLHAKSYAGMLDMIKMDIIFSPEFVEQDMDKRIQFAAQLFLNGCMSDHR
ncbi:TetR/AcrR family transcriptional regulator [Paenibacillus taiwanensis]|uniref:TetR/AcrR family transcriptional regulator n=1 Tax=Paenibacillus taiwanensis TaxID=401638 RepID=UPI000413830B|nr:TetR/AcrR family transcriptional regulator [Paenibacillus taiwanensis]